MCILCILACAYKYERSMHTLHSSRHSTSSYVQYGYNESYTYSRVHACMIRASMHSIYCCYYYYYYYYYYYSYYYYAYYAYA